jgi:hypothetical protein
MSSVELHASTGSPLMDSLLRGLVGVYDAAFPERLRCIYVVGSYSDGSAVPGSDLDVGVVFTQPLAEDELARFRQITRSLALISPVRLDCGTVNPERFTNGIPAGLKTALVVYGDNVFAGFPLEPLQQALRRAMSNTFHSLYLLRQRADGLVYPLKYPDAGGEYYGYERWGTYLGERTFGPGVRSLVTSVSLIASCWVMLRAGQRVGSKQESVPAYRRHVNDEWTEFVEQVYVQGKEVWHYELPETAKGRRQLRSLCKQMLAFENHFLDGCRAIVLSDLVHATEAIQGTALYRLKRIAYPGEDYEAALIALQAGENAEIAQGAQTVLRNLERAASSNVIE